METPIMADDSNRIIFPDKSGDSAKLMEQFTERVFAASIDATEWFTAPLITLEQDGSVAPRGHRSGVFMQIGERRFLVSAAHGMPEHIQKERLTCVVSPVKGGPHFPMVSKLWHTTINEVCLLEEPTVKLLEGHCNYLRMSDLLSRHRQRHGLYLIMGYPYQMIRPEQDGAKHASAWKYITYRYSEVEKVPGYDSMTHIVLKYERCTVNKEGETVHPPAMSGCGIWRIGWPRENVEAHEFQLVGIQTAWHKGLEYAKGTSVDVVMTIIWKYYPECRDVMRMHGFQL